MGFVWSGAIQLLLEEILSSTYQETTYNQVQRYYTVKTKILRFPRFVSFQLISQTWNIAKIPIATDTRRINLTNFDAYLFNFLLSAFSSPSPR